MNKSALFAAISLMVVIFALSSIPQLQLYQGHIPPGVMKWLQQHTVKLGGSGFFSYEISLYPDFILHKISHVVIYGSLGIALFLALNRSYAAVAWCMLYAFTDEIHQAYVLGRSARLGDVVLDTVAAALAVFCFCRFSKQKRKQ